MSQNQVKRGTIELVAKVGGIPEVSNLSTGFDKLQISLSNAGASMVSAITKGNLLAVGIQKIAGSMSDITATAMRWQSTIGSNVAAISGMRQATDGMVSALDLWHARQAIIGSGINATEEQFNAIAKAAVYAERVLEMDYTQALNTLSEAVVRGASKSLKQFGLEVQTSGDLATRQNQILKALEERFGGLSVKAEDAEENIAKMRATTEQLVGELGNAVLSSGAFAASVGLITDAVVGLNLKYRQLTGTMQDASEAERDLMFDTLDANARYEEFLGFQGEWTAKRAAFIQENRDRARRKRETAEDKEARQSEAGEYMAREYGVGVVETVGGGKAEKRRAGGGRKKDKPKTAQDIIEEMFAKDEQQEGIARLAGETAREMFPDKQIKGAEKMAKAIRGITKELTAEEKALKKSQEARKDSISFMAESGIAVLEDFGGALWNAAAAAIENGDSFGVAMAQMLKGTLLSIAGQATVKAVFETAEGFAALATYRYDAAANHFTAAGTYAAIAAVSGGAGLGIAAATKGSGGGAGGGTGTQAGGIVRRDDAKPSFGEKREDDKRPIILKITLGNMTDPSAAKHASKQIAAQMKAA